MVILYGITPCLPLLPGHCSVVSGILKPMRPYTTITVPLTRHLCKIHGKYISHPAYRANKRGGQVGENVRSDFNSSIDLYINMLLIGSDHMKYTDDSIHEILVGILALN